MVSFDRGYFMDGAESNYVDYNKRKYKKLAKDIKKILKLNHNKGVLDYGCGTGILVKELYKYCDARGTDISKWAIAYGIDKNKLGGKIHHYEKDQLSLGYDYVIILDVLEHCKKKEIKDIFKRMSKNGNLKSVLVRIPVSAIEGRDFVLDVSKKDKTHIQIHSKCWWHELFLKYDFDIINVVKEKTIYNSDGVLVWQLKRK